MFPRQVFFRPCWACVFFCLVLLHACESRAQTWREVKSPHFRVVTDGSERDGREVAKEFEQMRSVFAARFNNAVLETGSPLLVVAVRESGLRYLTSRLWKDRDRVAGEFFSGWERKFALVRLDKVGDFSQVVVFDEYAHSILHANLHWLPTWLDEGMAEFYGYTRFDGDHIYVGAPSFRLKHLERDPLISIGEMLAANGKSFGNDDRRADLFYGEAWAMVHYMTFAPDMGGGAKLQSFIALLEAGTPQLKAFEQVFGDQKEFQEKLALYLSKFSMAAALMPPAPGLDDKAFTSRVLTAAETSYVIGAFDVGAHDPTEAKTRLESAEKSDPALAGPHEELGFLAWREGKDGDARKEWQQAVAADAGSYRAAFALLMSGVALKDQIQEQLAETEHALEAIHEQAPKYAPVVVEQALVEWRLGQMTQAYKSALAAEKLEPWRAGYHLLVGHLLLQARQIKAAETNARTVASRWPGADHDEAVDLWNMLAADARGDGPALTLAMPAEGTVMRGKIVSSSCGGGGLHVVLQPDTAGAPAVTLLSSGRFESGFSDTLWVGEDHYTTCFHLAGLPAVVAYKSARDGTGQLMVLEVRDDLPGL